MKATKKSNAGKIKLSFDEPRFFVNKKKRTVTCKLIAYPKFPYEIFMALDVNDDPIIVTTTVKCNEGDKFDVVLGRHIAESKAKKIAFQRARVVAMNSLRLLAPIIKSFVNFEEDMDRLSNYEIEHLGDLADMVESE